MKPLLFSTFSIISFFSVLPSSAAEEKPVTIENIWVGFTRQPGQSQYKVGEWAPVWVDLKAGRERFSGVLEVEVPDDDGTPTVFRRGVDLQPGEFVSVPTHARAGARAVEFQARVFDERGRRQASRAADPAPIWVEPNQELIVTLGHPSGVEEITRLPGFEGNPSNGLTSRVVVATPRIPGGLPTRWFDYDGVKAVVLDTNDSTVLDALRLARGTALQEWVRRGGHLVIAIGGLNWQRVGQSADSLLAPLLPVRPAGQDRLPDPGALETFAGSSSHPLKPPVPITRLELVEGHNARVLDANAGSPLIVRGTYGFGLVTVVGLDVDQKPFADWEDRALFWANVLDLQHPGEDSNSGGLPGSPGGFYQNYVSDLATVLHTDLEQSFEGVQFIPFGYVAFFVFLYILLIGPGDYLFLKKVLGRMELTWITFPAIVLTVSLLAYGAAYTIKGRELRINKVDAVDVDQQSGLVRGTTWFTLFSPQNRDYDLSLVPQAPGSQAEPIAPAGAEVPTGVETDLSWFGVPESRFGGMSNSGGMGLSNTPYLYEPLGEPRGLEGVRVPIWTTKSFAGRWSGRAGPILDAQLQLIGADRLAGTITNQLDEPLRDAWLLYRNQAYKLQTLEPGETRSLATLNDRSLPVSSFVENRIKAGTSNQNAPNPNSHSSIRSQIVQAMMFNQAAGPGNSPGIASSVFPELDLSGQLALSRPMLVADIAGAAVSLNLGDTSAPHCQQQTVLRVLLPPPRSEEEPEPRDSPENTPTH